MKSNLWLRAGLLLAACSLAAVADDQYILRLGNSSGIGQVAGQYGLNVVRSLRGSARGLFVVGIPSGPLASSIVRAVASDAGVSSIEPDSQVTLPELAGVPVRQPGGALPPLYNAYQTVDYYGAMVWGPYVSQPATSILGVAGAQQLSTGLGAVVALIDTGVDPNNLVLRSSLTGGYDFIRDIPGGSEMADVNQSTTEVLDQSTTEVLDFTDAVILSLNQSTTEVLDQSTTEVLDQSTTEVLDQNPPPVAFGHGTMTAGLVHLVAPRAKLMPLKAFSGAGTATVSAVVEAIYYALDNGADVINMSFSATQDSNTLRQAVQDAFHQGVICVAAVGNAGQQTSQIFPASYPHVIGVASVNNQDQRSSFSNYGNGLVSVAAPGEGVISTYPGTNNYAAGWGTSFSTPLVAGGAALLVQISPDASVQSIANAFQSGAIGVGQGLGAGVVDLPPTILALKGWH